MNAKETQLRCQRNHYSFQVLMVSNILTHVYRATRTEKPGGERETVNSFSFACFT